MAGKGRLHRFDPFRQSGEQAADLGGGAATLAFVMGLAASAGPFRPSISSRTGSYAELADALPGSPSRVAGIELRKSWKVETTRGSTPAESRGPHVEMWKLAR